MKDNLKDKLRSLPIEVNVEIVKPSGRKKRQSTLSELSPVLAASQPLRSEVNDMWKIGFNYRTSMNMLILLFFVLLIVVVIVFLSQVNFVKEGCGADLQCQSNLKLESKLCSREQNQDVFKPLSL